MKRLPGMITILSIFLIAAPYVFAFKVPEIGDEAPVFTLPTIEDKRISLDDFWKNQNCKATMISFYFIGCKPCLPDLQFLQSLQKEFGKSNFDILVVSIDKTREKSTVDFLSENQVSLPLVFDRLGIVEKRYFGEGKAFFPANFLIDGRGILREKYIGYKEKIRDKIKQDISKLLEM
jgi:peroxiredoxin